MTSGNVSLADFERIYSLGQKDILRDLRKVITTKAYPIGHDVDQEEMVVSVRDIRKVIDDYGEEG